MKKSSNSSDIQEWIHQAHQYIILKRKNISTSDRVFASRLGKRIVLGINETYKKTKNPELMELMKAVTNRKRTIDKRLKKSLIIAH